MYRFGGCNVYVPSTDVTAQFLPLMKSLQGGIPLLYQLHLLM